MNMRNASLALSVAAALASPAYATAADRTHRCAAQFDDAQRLACYDAEYGKPGNGGAAGAAARTAVVQSPPSDARAAEDTRPKAPTAPPRNSTASIKTLSSFRDGRFKATLDSGEVWAQLEPDKAVVLAVGDKVTVKKAMLGSFQLVTPAGLVTRVKQVK